MSPNIKVISILLMMSFMLAGCKSTDATLPAASSGAVVANLKENVLKIADNVQLINLFNPTILGKDTVGYSVASVTMQPGTVIPRRYLSSSEVQCFYKGAGKVEIDGKTIAVGPGVNVYIPKNAVQKTINDGTEPLEYYSIVEPAYNATQETIVKE